MKIERLSTIKLDGKPLSTWIHKGERGWLACELATVLGASPSSHEFGSWFLDLIAGQDYVELRGRAYKEVKQLLSRPTERPNSAILLRESGLRSVLQRTGGSVGQRVLQAVLPSSPAEDHAATAPPTAAGASSLIAAHQHFFEGDTSVRTIVYKGRPCWLARDVGRWIGYANDGKQFVRQVLKEWSEELIEGEDVEFLRGSELNDIKRLLGLGVESTPAFELGAENTPSLGVENTPSALSHARHLVVLYESGLDLALLRTHKPKGKALRRWLKREVLPQIRRAGRYDPSRTVNEQGQVVDRSSTTPASVLDAHEYVLELIMDNPDLDVAEIVDRVRKQFDFVLDAGWVCDGDSVEISYPAEFGGAATVVAGTDDAMSNAWSRV